MEFLRWAVIISLLGAIGCASSVRYADAKVTPEEIQDRVRENHDRILGVRGSGTISVDAPEMAQSGSFEVELQKPDSLLLRLEGPFGIDVGSMLVTRREFFFYNSFNNQVIVGPTTAENLSRTLRIPMEFDDVLNLFTGGFFLSADRSRPDRFVIEDDRFVLTYNRSSVIRRYWVDPRSYQIVKVQFLDAQGQPFVELQFSRFHDIEGASIPHYIRVTLQKERRMVSIAYSDLSVNPPHFSFRLDVPSDASRARLP